MGRDAAGVSGMNLKDGSHLVDITTSLEGDKILVLSTLGYGKISYAKATDTAGEDGSTRHYDGYRLTRRGAKGVLSLKSAQKNGSLIAMRAVKGDEDLMIITDQGIVIRTPLLQVKISARNTQGVKIIALEERAHVASIAIVPHIDENAPVEEAPDEEINPALVAPSEDEPVKKGAKAIVDDEPDEDASSSDGASGSGKDDDI